MERVQQYIANAAECRTAAQRMGSGAARSHLLKMAEMWEGLAREREAVVAEGVIPPDSSDGGL